MMITQDYDKLKELQDPKGLIWFNVIPDEYTDSSVRIQESFMKLYVYF